MSYCVELEAVQEVVKYLQSKIAVNERKIAAMIAPSGSKEMFVYESTWPEWIAYETLCNFNNGMAEAVWALCKMDGYEDTEEGNSEVVN
jgi:hypothetical protein